MKVILWGRKLIWKPWYSSDLLGWSSEEWGEETLSSSEKSSSGIFEAIRGERRVSVTYNRQNKRI